MSKNKKTEALRQEKRISLIYWERVRDMHLRVPVETQQVRIGSGPELDLPFLFIWEWNGTFANRPDFWFTFPYHTNFEPILNWLAGFVSLPLSECNLSPTSFLKRTGEYQYKIAPMAV